ncbi:MAG TPA: hypothetical protein HPP77_08970, partial [Candidatus Hydrogenedentes bacterium]|nr:hypothetical protein [Candidatus Hydrogenedentota bacterium]
MSSRSYHDLLSPFMVAGVCAAGLFLFAYAYTQLVFPAVEAADPDRFEEHVAAALVAGDLGRALDIARHAAHSRSLDPATHAVYAELLLENNDVEGAAAQVAEALRIRKGAAPGYRKTRAPFYCARARLLQGQLKLRREDWLGALADFELARPFARLSNAEFATYHSALYTTYTRFGMWGRALEFDKPSVESLAALADDDLLQLARACEGQRNWDLAEGACRALIARDHGVPEARCILGKAYAATGRPAESLTALSEA